MLYKKYHRDFVKRFKNGVKYRYNDGIENIIEEVIIEPFIYWCSIEFFIKFCWIELELPDGYLKLIDEKGIFNKYIHVV